MRARNTAAVVFSALLKPQSPRPALHYSPRFPPIPTPNNPQHALVPLLELNLSSQSPECPLWVLLPRRRRSLHPCTHPTTPLRLLLCHPPWGLLPTRAARPHKRAEAQQRANKVQAVTFCALLRSNKQRQHSKLSHHHNQTPQIQVMIVRRTQQRAIMGNAGRRLIKPPPSVKMRIARMNSMKIAGQGIDDENRRIERLGIIDRGRRRI